MAVQMEYRRANHTICPIGSVIIEIVSKQFKSILFIIPVVILLLIISGLVYFFWRSTSVETEINIPLKSLPHTNLNEQSVIPGVTLKAATSYLEDNNFVCLDKPEAYQEIYYRFSCEQVTPEYAMTVHIFSQDQKSINLIDTNFAQMTTPSDDQSINFLGFMTRLSIEDNDSNQVDDWIKTSLSDLNKYPEKTEELTINRLHLRVYGAPNDRYLEIGKIE